jgi:NAD(P)-dependent dehydrogenase (short-subunit alcohol dehydrogenase family)
MSGISNKYDISTFETMPTIIVKSGLGVDTANDEWILLPYNGKGWKISVAWVRSEQICLEHQKLIFQVIIFYARTMAASTTSGVVTNIRPYLVSGILGMTSLIAMWSGLATNNKKGLNQFFGTLVGLLELDVADEASVHRATATLTSQITSLDVLINNAGIAVDMTKPPSEVQMKDMKAVFEVNLFGPVRVTQAFLPLLKAANQARIVMMSSGVGSLTLITDPTSIYSTVNLLDYTSSKVALNAVMVSFAKELAPLGIKVNAVEPGHVRTDLNGNSGVLTPEEGAATAIKMALLGPEGPTGGFFGSHGRQPW